MEAIFQQAPFDDKNDLKRIKAIAKEVEERERHMLHDSNIFGR